MLRQFLGSLRVVCAILLCAVPTHQVCGQQLEKADLYGDPLPPGAVARLGTVRFRQGGDSFSPDVFFLGKSSTLLTASGSASLRFWDARTGVLQRELLLHPFNIHKAAVSADGKQIALTGTWYSEDKTQTHSEIRVLNARTSLNDLLKSIMQTISPEEWKENGGRGTIARLGNNSCTPKWTNRYRPGPGR